MNKGRRKQLTKIAEQPPELSNRVDQLQKKEQKG